MSNTDDELDNIFLGQHTNHAEEVCDTLYPENKDICTCWVAEAKQGIKAYTDKAIQKAVTERDSVWVKTQQIVADAFGGDLSEHPQPHYTNPIIDQLEALMQRREKEARIDELGKLRIPTQTLRDQVDARLATLRGEE